MPSIKFGVADAIYDSLRLRSNDALIASTGTIPGAGVGLLNRIYLWPADASTISDYDPTEAGLIAALAAGTSGDTIFLPSLTITLTGNLNLKAGVEVYGMGREKTIILGALIGAAAVVLGHLTVINSGTSGSAIKAITGPTSGEMHVYDCTVTGNNSSGVGWALFGQAGGQIRHRYCVLSAQSGGADSNPISSSGSGWSVGAQVSTGSVTVTSETGDTISGLTVGQWYALECTGGPWNDGGGGSWYRYQLSNSGVGGFLVTINELNGNIPAWCSYREMPDATHIRVYFQATTTSILIRVGDLPGLFYDNTGSLGWKLSLATAPSGTVTGYASVIENVAGRIATELEGGDRGAFNTNDSGHAVFHASDIESGAFVYHNNPNVPGTVLGSYIFVASQIGAKLDTSLTSGGGTNDTSPLQDILNIAAGGSRVLLIMDGPALVSGLDVYGNTTIYCMEGAGFYLANGSNREIIRNANRSRTTITDEHISLIGGYYNANHTGQTGVGPSNHQQADNTFMNGISFFGVNHININGVTVVNPMGFGINTGNANYVTMHDIRVDAGSSPHINQDGIHLNGPQSYVYISDSKIYSYDDAIAINAGDDSAADITIANIHGPYVGQGLISNVIIDGVEFVGALRGFRILSHDSNSRIDQVYISNVTGSVAWVGVWCSPEGAGNGDIGTISIDGWDVRQLADANSDRASMYWTGYIDRLILRNIEIYQPIDTRPVIYFHTGFVGQSVTIDGFHDYDSAATGGTPISVKGHIVRFEGSNLSWVRNASSRGTALILLDNAASRIEYVTLDGVIVDNVNFVFSQTAGTVPTTILAANINHLVPSTNATISTTGGTITDVCISNWYGYSPFSGTATTKRGDAFGVSSSSFALTNTHIFVGNASNVPTDVAMSNDATISNTGALTLKNTGPGATGPIGSTTAVPVITIDAQGRVTALSSAAISSGISGAVSVYNETINADGVSTIYHLTNYATPGTIRIYIDGIRQPASDDIAPTDIVSFGVAPDLGAVLLFDYEMDLA